MDIEFSKLDLEERERSFELYKTYMKPVIEDAFGWDEKFQRNGFESNLDPDWFSWILVQSEKGGYLKAGLVCSRFKRRSLHIHLFLVFAEEQRKRIGHSAVQKLKEQAYTEKTNVTLSCFKNNIPALSFYKSLGFVVESEEEYFYRFVFRNKNTAALLKTLYSKFIKN